MINRNKQTHQTSRSKATLLSCLLFSVYLSIGPAVAGELVSPSYSNELQAGQKIAELKKLSSGSDAVLQRLSEDAYWVSIWGYNSMFYVGKEGVLLFDALSGGKGQKILDAIHKVSKLPVTMLVYSHSHLDHISDAKVIVKDSASRGAALEIVASDATLKEIRRFSLDLPLPTQLVAIPQGQFLFEGKEIQVFTPVHFAHTPDSSLFYMPSARLVQYVDVTQPGELPYFDFNFGMGPRAFEDALSQALSLSDWDYLNGGHGNIGSRDDIKLDLEYLQDVKVATAVASKKIKYGEFMQADRHSYESFDKFMGALTADVRKQIAAKYGEGRGLDAILRGHVELVRIQQALSQY